MRKSEADCQQEAAGLNAGPAVRYVGLMSGYPLFQQDPPGVGSFTLLPEETTVAQAYKRALARYAEAANPLLVQARRTFTKGLAP